MLLIYSKQCSIRNVFFSLLNKLFFELISKSSKSLEIHRPSKISFLDNHFYSRGCSLMKLARNRWYIILLSINPVLKLSFLVIFLLTSGDSMKLTENCYISIAISCLKCCRSTPPKCARDGQIAWCLEWGPIQAVKFENIFHLLFDHRFLPISDV